MTPIRLLSRTSITKLLPTASRVIYSPDTEVLWLRNDVIELMVDITITQ
jgi:hypothetical protein